MLVCLLHTWAFFLVATAFETKTIMHRISNYKTFTAIINFLNFPIFLCRLQ